MQLSKENADRIKAMIDGDGVTVNLHPLCRKRYQELLEAADIKRGPGRPKKEPEPEAPPHDDYVPVKGEDPATET